MGTHLHPYKQSFNLMKKNFALCLRKMQVKKVPYKVIL